MAKKKGLKARKKIKQNKKNNFKFIIISFAGVRKKIMKMVDKLLSIINSAKELLENMVRGIKEVYGTIIKTASTSEDTNFSEGSQGALQRKVCIKYSMTVLLTLILISLIVQFNFRPVVVVSIKGKPVAVVPTKKDFEKVLVGVQTKWSKIYNNKEIKLNDSPTFRIKILPKKFVYTPEQVANAIEGNTNLLIEAAGISVNGQVKAALKDQSEAQQALTAIKNKYVDPKAGEQADFCEEVKIVSTFVLPDLVLNIDKAVGILTKNIDASKEYKVKEGDTLWDIAKANNVAVEKLCLLNPQVQDDIFPGQVIRLSAPTCEINVKTLQYVNVEEVTPFETKFESDDKKYRGDRKTIAQGKTGKKELKVQLVEQNGIEVGRVVLNENVVTQPKAEIIAVGTKQREQTSTAVASGTFRVPAFGSVTSRFGFRWGRAHEGIDIAGSIGDPVCAADGGVVIFAGAEGGYGNFVKIDHGNGYVTCYGHNSRILVKAGQRVSKGAKIALLGNTGNSTGPHLHFEVRKNGTPMDPLKFLR